MIQILFGLAILIPYLTIIGCLDFYQLKMPDYHPESTYSFGVYITLVPGIIAFTIYGHRFSQTMTLITCFSGACVFFSIIPFLANLGGTKGYWSTFAALLCYGFFNGIS